MVNYLHRWIGQLRWRRLSYRFRPQMLIDHLDEFELLLDRSLPLGVVEAINRKTLSLCCAGSRGYKNLRYLLLKAQRLAATRTGSPWPSGRPHEMGLLSNSYSEPDFSCAG